MRLLLIPAFCLAGLPALAGELTVQVTGGAPCTGQVLVTLFDAPDRWMREPIIDTSAPINSEGGAMINFADLAAGKYGISIIYDENANGELDTNIFGIPSEPFGFSNNASALFGPPGWEKAAFAMDEGAKTITIRLDRAE